MSRNHNPAGEMCNKGEMMKAWDGPGGHADKGAVKSAGKFSGIGGMKKEAGASDPNELK